MGEILDIETLRYLLWEHQHVSCICFMGGINDYQMLGKLMAEIKDWGKKVAIYSGHDFINKDIEPFVDYYKIGPYKPECGPLNSPTTNQKFYKKENNT